jgi:cytochrome c biogenesis protein CcmG/thiol:disulfide interchange protein DsbE
VRAFAEKEGLTFPILLDEHSDVAKRYRVRSIPTSFFISREGVIQAQHTGPLTASPIRQYLDPIL